MIETAEKTATLKKGTQIIEPTSGTRASAGVVAAAKDTADATMPESMSLERRPVRCWGPSWC